MTEIQATSLAYDHALCMVDDAASNLCQELRNNRNNITLDAHLNALYSLWDSLETAFQAEDNQHSLNVLADEVRRLERVVAEYIRSNPHAVIDGVTV